jgi:hypothetical protein
LKTIPCLSFGILIFLAWVLLSLFFSLYDTHCLTASIDRGVFVSATWGALASVYRIRSGLLPKGWMNRLSVDVENPDVRFDIWDNFTTERVSARICGDPGKQDPPVMAGSR